MFDPQSQACIIYKNSKDRTDIGYGQLENQPWLFYSSSAWLKAMEDTSYAGSFTFDKSKASDSTFYLLNLWVAKFSIYGKMVGFTRLQDEFILCPHTTDDITLS